MPLLNSDIIVHVISLLRDFETVQRILLCSKATNALNLPDTTWKQYVDIALNIQLQGVSSLIPNTTSAEDKLVALFDLIASAKYVAFDSHVKPWHHIIL